MHTTRIGHVLAAIVLLTIAGCGASPSVTEVASPREVVRPTASPAEDRASSSQADSGRCAYLGVDGVGDMQIELTFTSDVTEQQDVFANYSVSDGDRIFVASEDYIEDLLPGERVRMNVDTVTQPPTDDANVTCRFKSLSASNYEYDEARPAAGDTCVFVKLDSAGDMHVDLDVATPFGAETTVAIDYALRSSDGVRFFDDVAFAYPPHNARIAFESDSVRKPPAWVDIDAISCEILALVPWD